MNSIFLVPLVLFLGYISYRDWKEKKIRNKHVLALLIGGLLVRGVDGALFEAPYILFLAYSAFISILLWLVGIWPAGDAKLFIALSMFFPFNFYDQKLLFDFFVNVFTPIFFSIVFILLWKSGIERIKEALEFTFDPYRVSLLIMILLGFVAFMQKGLSILGIRVGFFINILILFVAFEVVYTFLSFQMEIFMLLLVVLRILFDFWDVFTFQYLIHFSSLIGAFLFFRFFILYLAYYAYTEKIELEDLETGMSLAEGIRKSEEGYTKEKLLKFSLIGYFSQRKQNFIHSLGYLDQEDLDKIKELKKKGDLEIEEIRIHQKQPFAVFLTIGFLITFLTGTNFINALKVFLIK